jgi:hypothetical protein
MRFPDKTHPVLHEATVEMGLPLYRALASGDNWPGVEFFGEPSIAHMSVVIRVRSCYIHLEDIGMRIYWNPIDGWGDRNGHWAFRREEDV